ncbi:hypothetical protein HELRODRAFT_179132 [Helobdella robusta]|uniref:Uncharacterized protein n=1 Tax=Helobdella robusta TaxID=6412 RepID=T1FE79_HELRO|nr:hypothetical protein HELRODRAFT_179132 [Helobdella robusta]ESN95662.1 hypothetical protein HELRODRAFT_179132 [Helobdella robusta]
MFIQTFIEKSNLKPLGQNTAWSTSINKIKNNLLTARSLIDVNKPSTSIRVCNISDEKVEIPKDQVITKLHEVVVVDDEVQESNNKPTKEYDETIKTIVDEVYSSVPNNIRGNLRKLLLKYKNILSLSEFDLGRTNVTQHEIDTGANRPFRQALRPQPRAHLPIIDNLLEEMLQQKPIRLDGPVKTGRGCAKADRLTDRLSENRPLVVRKPIRLDGPVKTGQGCAKADRLTDRPSENRPLVVRKPIRLDGPVKTGQGCAKADRLTDRPSENRPLVVRKPIRLDGPVKTGQGCAKADRLTDRPSENRPWVL